jgi:predicted Zn-dependent protease
VSRNNLIIPIIILTLVSCSSTYKVPKESKVTITKEELPSYNPKQFSKVPKKDVKKLQNEDELIIKAIFLEEVHNFRESSKYYSILYDATHKEEYLLKALTTAHYAGMPTKYLKELQEYIHKNPKNLQAKRLLLSFYIKDKKFEKAKGVGSQLSKVSKKAVDDELAANPYIFTGEYEKALSFLKKAYLKTYNEDILLKIITIEINYLNQIDRAIQDLEQHRKTKGCSEKICLQLVAIYSQQANVNKLTEIYKELYHATHKRAYLQKTIEAYLYTQKTDEAIKYLEEGHKDDTMLYSLYMEKKKYHKAHQLTQKLIKETKEAKWYAESAISYYESLKNKDDKSKLSRVVHDFEEAIKMGIKDPIYLNYYGYTLIDKDLDVNKGLNIIYKALKEEPENTYFLDSLAWGYYKLNQCDKAYPTMKKVVDIEGLNEDEIVEHWNAIKSRCK